MNRRHLLLACLFLRRAAADERDDVLQVFVPLASALSSGDAEAFLKPIDSKMAGFEQLRQNVYGLIAQFEIKSSIELMRVESGRAELDWFMELRRRDDAGGTQQRRKAITARFEKKRILSIEPIDFFAPVQF
jgi:hypothetical protein